MKITKQDLVNAEINGCNNADSIWNYLISTKDVKHRYGMFIGMIFVVFGLFMLYGLSIKNDNIAIHLISLLSFVSVGIFIYNKSNNNKNIIDKLSEWIIIPTCYLVCFSVQYLLDHYKILLLDDPTRIFYLKLDFINLLILSIISLFFFYKDRNHLMLTTAFIVVCFLIDIILKGIWLPQSGSIYNSVLYNEYEIIRNNSILLFSFITLIFGMFKFNEYMISLKYISYIPLIFFTDTIYNYNYSNEIFDILISSSLLIINYIYWKDKPLNFLIIIGVIFKLFMYNHYDFDSLETLVILTFIFGYSLKNEYNKLSIFTFLIITFTIERIIGLKDVYQIMYYILIGLFIILFMFLSKKYNIKNPLKKTNN